MKTNFSIEEYSFGQTTLEQVFIKFAKDQEIEEDHEESETLWKIFLTPCNKIYQNDCIFNKKTLVKYTFRILL